MLSTPGAQGRTHCLQVGAAHDILSPRYLGLKSKCGHHLGKVQLLVISKVSPGAPAENSVAVHGCALS